MSENGTDNRNEPRWRDPLSIGWQAHRGLLLLRLRWHQSSARRGTRTGDREPRMRFSGQEHARRRRGSH